MRLSLRPLERASRFGNAHRGAELSLMRSPSLYYTEIDRGSKIPLINGNLPPDLSYEIGIFLLRVGKASSFLALPVGRLAGLRSLVLSAQGIYTWVRSGSGDRFGRPRWRSFPSHDCNAFSVSEPLPRRPNSSSAGRVNFAGGLSRNRRSSHGDLVIVGASHRPGARQVVRANGGISPVLFLHQHLRELEFPLFWDSADH